MNVWRRGKRLFETVRYLKPVQIYGRLRFKLLCPSIDRRPAPPLRSSSGGWREPARRSPSMTAAETFRFLNFEASLNEVGWDGSECEKLWRYNQHYFDDLNAKGAARRLKWHQRLIEKWVIEVPAGLGNGWEPYPTSLRIVNWIKWALGGNSLAPVALHSLAVQTRWLSGRMEFHLQGNHLFVNAKALLFAGLFFEGEEANRWRQKGEKLLIQLLDEQFLADGAHFELSPMYHALALEDLLDLWNITTLYGEEELSALREKVMERLPGARHWLLAMCHPDGEISHFNDAAFDVAPSLEELRGYCNRFFPAHIAPQISALEHLENSGYLRMSREKATLICDLAEVGPSYLPGHAHADTLSFEFSYGEERVLTNSGTSCYGVGAERLRQRGTAAHNTVVVSGENSSDVWSGFRVGRRAHPSEVKIEAGSALFMASAAHDGYRFLPGEPLHSRRWILGDHALLVTDRLTRPELVAEARFHLHPAVQVAWREGGSRMLLRLPSQAEIFVAVQSGKMRLENSTYHPKFGESIPNQCIVVELVKGESALLFEWI